MAFNAKMSNKDGEQGESYLMEQNRIVGSHIIPMYTCNVQSISEINHLFFKIKGIEGFTLFNVHALSKAKSIYVKLCRTTFKNKASCHSVLIPYTCPSFFKGISF